LPAKSTPGTAATSKASWPGTGNRPSFPSSGATETRGWEQTLERYRKKYQGGGKEMGKLDFFDFRVEMLGPQSAFVRGHWHLQMKNGQEPRGLFTLILRKFPEGWRIIHDHTS
jgi:ketosteroid isomerase-like protein